MVFVKKHLWEPPYWDHAIHAACCDLVPHIQPSYSQQQNIVEGPSEAHDSHPWLSLFHHVLRLKWPLPPVAMWIGGTMSTQPPSADSKNGVFCQADFSSGFVCHDTKHLRRTQTRPVSDWHTDRTWSAYRYYYHVLSSSPQND